MKLSEISRNIEATATHFSFLVIGEPGALNLEGERLSFRQALLDTAVAVLVSDGPLNAYESLLLKELFGSIDDVDRAEVAAIMGTNLLASSMPILMRAVFYFEKNNPRYRPDHDPVVIVVSQILDAGLAADKFPSETEAWASSRVMTKLRQSSLEKPSDIAHPFPSQTSPAASPSVSFDSVPLPKDDQNEIVTDECQTPAEPMTKIDNSTLVVGSTGMQTLLTELNSLVGLQRVKEEVETLVNLAKVLAVRMERGLPTPEISFHLVFSGNPGTGKTTVARILGRIYGELGLLSKGKCIEVDRSALIGQYLGETTVKTAELLSKTLGSALFIDEAYSLTEGHADDYGKEAIGVILKFMEDNRHDFVLIVAGYTQKMDTFLGSNPGLRSRFSRTIEFPDYNLDELCEIFLRMCASDGYLLDQAAHSNLQAALGAILEGKSVDFANAREVRKLYEAAIENQANRIAGVHCTDDELCLLLASDLLDA